MVGIKHIQEEIANYTLEIYYAVLKNHFQRVYMYILNVYSGRKKRYIK